MFPDAPKTAVKAFDHACSVKKETRKPPETVKDQELRYLRNRKYYKDSKGVIAFCGHKGCNKTWTYEE